jgi:ribosomal protein L37AE/L43A
MKGSNAAGGKKNSSRSVYTEHRQSVERFQRVSDEVAELTAEAARLRAAVREGDGAADSTIEARDRLIELEARLRRVRRDNDEMEYYRDVGDILLRYYDTYESAADEPMVVAAPQTAASSSSSAAKEPSPGPRKKSILSFYQRDEPSTTAATAATAPPESRGSLFERYMEVVDPTYLRRVDEDGEDDEVCPHCKKRTRQLLTKDGVAHCTSCHTVERILVEVDKPSFKEPPTEVVYYAYKRINHYNECLNQIQAKEYTEIPNDVIDAILVELKKQKITNMAKLTAKKIRDILRKLGIHKYYEHTPFIMYKLNGIPPPRFGEELEEKLRQMFYAVQVPYLRHASHKRKNFLSYNYVFHKFLLILGRAEFLKHFPLLKSREKLHEQEQVFQKICGDLGWPFIKSI